MPRRQPQPGRHPEWRACRRAACQAGHRLEAAVGDWHMAYRFIGRIGTAVAAAAALTAITLYGQARPATSTGEYRAPRTADGKPNLNGIWQAVNSANWDLQ